MKPKQ